MGVRIRDVAAKAGVSPATVSLVLNGVSEGRVREETAVRVREAARSLGYEPNALARSLRNQRTHTIGLISDRIITTPYASRMIHGAQEAAWARGYILVVVNTEGAPELERDAVAALVGRQVEGFLYGTMYHRVVTVPERLRAHPLVLLDAESDDGDVPAFVPDEEDGGRVAADHLLAHGHRRIAHVTDHPDVPAAVLRLAGFRRRLESAGHFDGDLVSAAPAHWDRTRVSAWGYEATRELLSRSDRPTAVFAYNDRMAIGVYRAARELGLSIPEDLSVVGFDNHESVADELTPGLTTVALPHYELGFRATATLLDLIENPAATARPEVEQLRLEPCPLVERGSVSSPPRRQP